MASAKVVVIDDEPSLIKFVGMNLRARGYAVATARNRLDRIALLRDFAADLVLVDIHMVGMDGFAV